MLEARNRYQYLRGEIITGTILSRDDKVARVNIGGMNVGVIDSTILPKVYKAGDAVLAVVSSDYNNNGELVLDYTTANENADSPLISLKVGEILHVNLNSSGPVGLHGKQSGYDVFLPYSQMTELEQTKKDDLLGRETKAVIVQVNLYKNTVIVSTRLLQED